ncbi:MAG: diguanylate cyclase [Rhodocyclaceae bacterium]|nr:diguanylate cyclase [Rhodocyclaceae bacterium]
MMQECAEYQPRILIVDDDAGSIRVLSLILDGLGEIHFATNAEDALSLLHEIPFDLLLLDIQMPGVSGFDLCRRIKAQREHADLPILFVTAHSDVDSETTALEAGAVDFIPKPLNAPIVRARVRTHLALKQRSDQLRDLAAIDGLTGIPNRRRLDETLDRERRRACRTHADLSLLLIDVDYFKAYNDRYGHQAGDDCLRAIAQTLARCARRPGDAVARYGGEEFVIVVPGCRPEQALAFADKTRRAVQDLAIAHAGSEHGVVTVSIGVASFVFPCTDGNWPDPCQREEACRLRVEDLVGDADRALYAAKAAGRNRVMLTRVIEDPLEDGSDTRQIVIEPFRKPDPPGAPRTRSSLDSSAL